MNVRPAAPEGKDVIRLALPDVGEAELAEVEAVLRSGNLTMGPKVAELEGLVAAACGVEHAVAVSNGTAALHLAVLALEIGAGDEVIVPAYTFPATANVVRLAGAKPVLVDVDPDTFTLAADRLEGALSSRTRAIVPVHLYGQCADMEPVLDFARARGLRVVEDAAQAHGAEYGGRRAGTLGDAAAFSFYPTKNLGALGDGGAVVTSDPDVAERARLLRSYGERERFRSLVRGRNSRLDAIQAALLAARLPYVEGWNERRRELADCYTSALARLDLVLPRKGQGRRHVWHLYVVRSGRRDELRRELAARGVETLVHYPRPVHRHPAYADLARGEGVLEVTERLAGEIVSLPLSPHLAEGELDAVVEALADSVPLAVL